ncbi:SbcC/MukB-like Walker B domain-containing protein, partial [Actinoplanes campanulatus]|uniref:SbcC/MukB-like Walker B domain-containing protein n=1 Tax=Actinoplanes campanulatus TaxID=113559 RepID=UPI00194313FC
DADLASAAAEALSQAGELHRVQQARRDDEAAAFVGQVQLWVSGLRVLVLEPDEIPDLAVARDGDLSACALRVIGAQRRVEPSLRDQIMRAERDAEELGAERDQLVVEIADRETVQAAPPAPGWRPDRAGKRGAAFWDLVDFVPSVTEDRQAAIEGALLVGGLLDAWVDPHCLDAGPGDTLLRPAAAVNGPSLADVLVAHPSTDVSAEHVERILRGIPLSAPSVDGTVLAADQWHTPWLTAAAPPGWQPQYIGAAARAERQRRELERLRAELAELEPRVRAAEDKAVELRELLTVLGQEAHLPNFDSLQRERDLLVRANAAVVAAQAANLEATTRAGISATKAEDAWQTAAGSCANARVAVDTAAVEAATHASATAIRQLHESRTLAQLLVAAMTSRTARAGEKAALDTDADAMQLALTQAAQRDRQVRTSRAALTHFTDLEACLEALAASEADKDQAEAAEGRARGDFEQARAATDLARAERRRVATTQDGRQLPVERGALDEFEADVRRLAASCAAWSSSSDRLQMERGLAQKAARVAAEALTQAERAEAEAKDKRESADEQQYKLDEETRLYEQPYLDLVEELRVNTLTQEELGRQSNHHRELSRAAEILLVRLEEQAKRVAADLDAVHERRRIADEQLNELFDHDMIADITDGDSYRRPADFQQSIELAQRLTRHTNAEHARDQLKREGYLLNTELRRVADVFLRMGRHIIDQEFGTGGLRRIVLADSANAAETGNGMSLRQAVSDISGRLERLQNDYDEQLRKEIKESLLVQLRGQILTRIQLAHDIVDGISDTLKGVRTGVENVGVRIAWAPRTDDNEAAEALKHIQKPNGDGNYDDMYDFFATLLRTESGNETTAERIARVFDYRNWFAWKIEVTHKAFSDDAHPGEVFKEITSRKNPLDTLSTGEKRLASMLPLLAAIRSFYATPGHSGPRIAYIDELDAALDKTNLRTLLHLLRDWDFDVISTLPSMNKLLVPEVRSTAIHKIIKSAGGSRLTIPYIWDGMGLPQAVRIAAPAAHDGDEGNATA